MPVFASAISITALLPELALAAAGCAVLLVAQAGREAVRRTAPWVTLGGIVAALLISLMVPRLLSRRMTATLTGPEL